MRNGDSNDGKIVERGEVVSKDLVPNRRVLQCRVVTSFIERRIKVDIDQVSTAENEDDVCHYPRQVHPKPAPLGTPISGEVDDEHDTIREQLRQLSTIH